MKFAKVMFYLSVILFTGGCLGPGQGGCPSPGMAVSACGIQAQAHWGVRQGGVQAQAQGVCILACTEADSPPTDSNCCRWYASYWDAF